MKKSTPFYSFYLLFLITISNWAQSKPPVFIFKDSIDNKLPLKNIKSLNKLDSLLKKNGYFFYNAVSIKKDSTSQYLITLGNKTTTISIKKIPLELQKNLKTTKGIYYTTPQNLTKWIDKITEYYDTKGANFSEVKLINQSLKHDTLSCDLITNQSSKRYIEKTVVKGYSRFSERFLKYYIPSKKPFSKDFLFTTEEKIKHLNFVKNKKKPAVLFTRDSTFLYLYLEEIKANKLDALLGFSNQSGQKKIKFNGYINITLVNTLHKGESFAFKWKNTGLDQQEIDLKIENPYIFNSPINVGYYLNIFRQDSTYVNTKHEFNLGYQPHYKHLISSYYHSENSSVLKNNVNNINEYKKNVFGLKYTYTELNSLGIPRIKINLDAGIGNKKTPHLNIPQKTFASDLIYSIEITPTHHFYIRNRNAFLQSTNKSTNELYRIGGATTIRGFLEQSIVAHLYNYTNLEYRLFTNTISYLYGFSDVGYFENLTQKNNLISFGIGYTLGTPSGLLKISYAVGKSNNTTFNLNNGLFHINFITLF